MQITQKTAVDILAAAGVKGADGLSLPRLRKKINNLKETLTDGQVVDHPLFGDVMKVLNEGSVVEIIDETPGVETKTQDEIAGEAKAGKPPKQPKEKKEPPPKAPKLKGRTYYAGYILRKRGSDKIMEPITDEMVKEVDELCGKPNSTESMAWLKQAQNIIEGYESSGTSASTVAA